MPLVILQGFFTQSKNFGFQHFRQLAEGKADAEAVDADAKIVGANAETVDTYAVAEAVDA